MVNDTDTVNPFENGIPILFSVGHELAVVRSREELQSVLGLRLRLLMDFTYLAIVLTDPVTGDPDIFLEVPTRGSNAGPYPGLLQSLLTSDTQLPGPMLATPAIYPLEQLIQPGLVDATAAGPRQAGSVSLVTIDLQPDQEQTGLLYLFTEQPNSRAGAEFGYLQTLHRLLSAAVYNIRSNESIQAQLREISNYKEQLEGEQLYLREQIDTGYNHGEVIGQGPAMSRVFHLIDQVAPSDSTVLILGETGSGKELIARAIHNASPRRDKLMIKLNCAALPPTLIESELFGHEKGAFTGATERRIGKFELANNSSLFLDEIGELNPELQVKLLRALQEREIERIGGKGIIKVDVRIIAATNRNLAKEVQAGTFRSDLFYRLHVFPIQLPPLRDHKEDIAPLTAHFVARFAKKTGKAIKGISQNVLKKMNAYHWPGNIRELEHLIERSVLMATGPVISDLSLPKTEIRETSAVRPEFQIKSIYENERDHILNILRLCNGKISGTGGAAEILGIPATTLNSKIKKFNIRREHIVRPS